MSKSDKSAASIEKQNLSKVALKNSSYNFLSLFILKFGGLIFTIIIARILLPELFGVYALALSIVSIFLSISGLGIISSFLRYSSESLGKRKKSLFRGYFSFFTKVQSILVAIAVFALVFSARYLSNNVYNKPYLYPILLFSIFYILMESFKNFISTIFVSLKDLKSVAFLDALLQISKISFSLLAVILFTGYSKVTGLFIAFAISSFVVLLLGILMSFKKDKELYVGKREKIESKKTMKYFWFMGIASLSLALFASVDTLMLGRFVDSGYLGFYRAALSLVLTLASLFSLSGVLLPIFTQIHNKRFERGFHKTFRALMIFAIPAAAGMVFISRQLIFLVYGSEYLPSAIPLYFLSPLIIIAPLVGLYNIIFQSKEKPKLLAYGTIISLIINILLNYVLIRYMLGFGQESAIVGAALATVFSRIFFLILLSTSAKSKFGLKLRGIGLRAPIFATLVMSLFLLIYDKLVDLNLFYGIVEVIIGAGIYFGVLILIKGVTKQDWNILKSLIKR